MPDNQGPDELPADGSDRADTGTSAGADDTSAGGDGTGAPTSEARGSDGAGTVPFWRRPTRRRKILAGAVALIAVVAGGVGLGSVLRRKPEIAPHAIPERNVKPQLRVRRSLTDLQNEYAAGNKKPL